MTPLAAHQKRLEDWAEALLRPYLTRRAGTPRASVRPKEFNDPIWGTTALLGHEVFVLDSPLLQRLRRIRQLGVAHLVYPAAQHTRVEHSLGVTHQVQRLVDGINNHPVGPGDTTVDADLLTLLRLAALCHDVGHGLMSHVVENALNGRLEIVRLLKDFKQSLDLDKSPQLGEAAAYYVLGSPAFGELMEKAFEAGGTVFPPDGQRTVQQLVAGQPISNRFPVLHELITGPFDADKLDYLPRDAQMCGVPVVTDVNRLVQKVRAVSKPVNDDLPEELLNVLGPDSEIVVVTGVARSGASTLDELALGRSLMFDKIYRHHKVRAAEAMVGAIVEQIGELLSPELSMLPLSLDDDELLRLTAARVTTAAGRDLTEQELVAAQVAEELAGRLADRQLHVRAFAYAQKMPLDPYKNVEELRDAMGSLIQATSREADRAEFLSDVAETAELVLRTVGDDSALAALPGGRLRPYLWVDPPASRPGDNQPLTGRAWLIDEHGGLVLAKEANAETQGWADAYVTTRHIGYVFSPPETAEAVHLATEAVARRRYGARIPESMLAYAKQDRARLLAARQLLAANGFYDGPLRGLRPLPPSLADKGTQARARRAAQALQGYSAPISIEQQRFKGKVESNVLSPERYIDWAHQFPGEVASSAMAVAAGVLFIDRPEINAALGRFLADGDGFAKASVCQLGDPKDGSSVVAYYSGDVARATGCAVRSLPEALLAEAPIVFVDDFVGRGSSAISIVEALLGEPPTTSLGEDRGEPLREDLRDVLRARRVAFVFAAGLESGRDALQARLADLGFADAVVHVGRAADVPTVASVLCPAGGGVEAFTNAAARIGRALLEDADRPDHDEAWRDQRALGYGNGGLLVVSAYNTPTATLTALWAAGTHDGVPWRPLFPRRPKN